MSPDAIVIIHDAHLKQSMAIRTLHRLSGPQRHVLAAYLTALVVFALLHFPFGSYHWSQTVTTKRGHYRCHSTPASPLSAEEVRNMTAEEMSRRAVEKARNISAEELKRRYEEADGCDDQTEQRMISPLRWSSDEPLVGWFGPLANLLIAVGALTLVVAAWLWAIGSRSERNDN